MKNKNHISSITKYLIFMLLFALYSSGCSDSPFSPPDGNQPTRSTGVSQFGLVEVTISGIGTDQMTATAQPAVSSVAANLTRPDDTPGKNGTIQLVPVSHGVFTYGTRGDGGVRYLYATFKVRNAQVDGTTYQSPRQNLTFLAVDTDASFGEAETYGKTVVSKFGLFNGELLTGSIAEDLAKQMIPTGLARRTAVGSIGVQYADVLQVYTQDEIATLTDVPAGVSLFSYGFVTRSPNTTPGSRRLLANPASGQFDGRVTFAFKLPLRAQASQDPFEIIGMFLPVDDSKTRITQSLEGQTTDGRRQTTERAAALDVLNTSVFLGSRYYGARREVCGPVGITGPAGNPATVLFPQPPTFSSLSPNPYATDGSASNVPATQVFSADFSATISGADVDPASFVVNGQQSGLQFIGQPYTGGGTFTISTPQADFFPGEQVEVSLTLGLGICPGGGTYRYRVETTAGTGNFGTGTTIATGDYPTSIAVGDLNSDGNLDMVTVNRHTADVSVLLGDGFGGLSTTGGSQFAVRDFPASVALGDVNRDGNLDMAVANLGGDDVSVLLGKGNGGFIEASGSPFAVANGPRSVALGDLNGDGALDIATGNYGSNSVSVLLGNGFGGFAPAADSPFNAGDYPYSIVLGDFNGDKALDVAVANYTNDEVSVLMGDGFGGLSTAGGSQFAVGDSPMSLAIGDVNRDGALDMVTANYFSDDVSVLLGDGSGGFSTAGSFAAGDIPRSVALGDVNGDGTLDIAVGNRYASNVWVLLGDGAGGFIEATASPFAVGNEPYFVALGDMNGDGALDIMTANTLSDNVSVLLGQLGSVNRER